MSFFYSPCPNFFVLVTAKLEFSKLREKSAVLTYLTYLSTSVADP
jgi:hypothetical protein